MSEKSVIKKQKKKWFQFRAFVSLLAVLTFGMTVLSGAALFMAPSGRSGHLWTFWGLSKHQWEDHHNWYCLVFVAVCLLHLVLNFQPILYYLKIIGSKAYRIRFEWLLAAGVSVLVSWESVSWRPYPTDRDSQQDAAWRDILDIDDIGKSGGRPETGIRAVDLKRVLPTGRA